MANIKKYKKKVWKDHLVEYPDRRILKDLGNGIVELTREGAEGDIYQEGDPIYADYLNNMETGIENNNKGLIDLNEDLKEAQLKLLILQAALIGDVSGGLLIENFDTIDGLTIENGIYDPQEKYIYCYDSNGEKIILKGLGAAIA